MGSVVPVVGIRQSPPIQSRQYVKKAVADGVAAVIGMLWSSHPLTKSPYFHKKKITINEIKS